MDRVIFGTKELTNDNANSWIGELLVGGVGGVVSWWSFFAPSLGLSLFGCEVNILTNLHIVHWFAALKSAVALNSSD